MKKIFKFNFNAVLLMFALIPLLVGGTILLTVSVGTSQKEIKKTTNTSMIALANGVGEGINNYISSSENILKTFTTAPIVKDALLNPNDTDIQAKAQQYTLDFFAKLEGWEGIYIADWNSKVLTHPAPPVIGKVMREGDALKSLQDSMINSENGVYNTGIITSPASGELIISMYAPVYDGDKIIGYAGGGTFMEHEAIKYEDVSVLNLDTAYLYIVDKEGTMIFHKNPEKIGSHVENEVVAGLVEDIANGKHPESKCIEYKYDGKMKYASYFVGNNEEFIAVITADAKDVLTDVNKLRNLILVIYLIITVIFIVIALYFSKVFVTPFKMVTEAIKKISDGNINDDVNVHSIVEETKQLISSAATLQKVLQNTISKTKSISNSLNDNAKTVYDLADNSANGASQITSAMEDLAQGATVVADNTQTINSVVSDMGVAIEDIASNTEELTKSSDNIKVANREATDYMEKVSMSSEKSIEAVNKISSQIEDTNEAVSRIKNTVNIISDIASQTNLLALNASIEAARAGETGRGFAVVANEIKHLSEQSNLSTDEIKKIVDDIVNKSDESVKLSSEVASIIVEEQKFIKDTQGKFDILNSEISVSLEQIVSIGKKVKALNDSTTSITSSVVDLGTVAEENAASNEEVSASVSMVAASIQQISDSSEKTKNMAQELDEAIKYFR